MSLINVKCTNCGAILKIDNIKDAAICEYCRSAFSVEKAIDSYAKSNSIENINDLKKDDNITNHNLENLIISEYIRCLKLYLKIQSGFKNIEGKICGYVEDNQNIHGFSFVEERLGSAPKYNKGFLYNGMSFNGFLRYNGCRMKDSLDSRYIIERLTIKLEKFGFKNAVVKFYINPRVKFERKEIRKFFGKSYETKEIMMDEKGYCCIYIEVDV